MIEAQNSQEVLDFNLYLSQDHFRCDLEAPKYKRRWSGGWREANNSG